MDVLSDPTITAITTLPKRSSRMEEFHITPHDLDRMTLIGRVSSYQPGKAAWTELAIYHRPIGFTRPIVAVSEGWKLADQRHEKVRFAFKFLAAGTLRRALDWFDDSELAHSLEATVGDWTPPKASKPVIGYRGPKRLTDALAWLYPEPVIRGGRTLGIAKLFEEDFGVSQRTVNDALAFERSFPEATNGGDYRGPWVKPILAALYYFDRASWIEDKQDRDAERAFEASREEAAHVA